MRGEEQLRQELDEFKREKDRISQIVGQIGGSRANTGYNLTNTLFVVIIVLLLVFGGALKKIPLEYAIMFGILLVALKIVWMINESQKVSHFQFWILNSVEFRINEISKKINKLDKSIKELNKNLEKMNSEEKPVKEEVKEEVK